MIHFKSKSTHCERNWPFKVTTYKVVVFATEVNLKWVTRYSAKKIKLSYAIQETMTSLLPKVPIAGIDNEVVFSVIIDNFSCSLQTFWQCKHNVWCMQLLAVVCSGLSLPFFGLHCTRFGSMPLVGRQTVRSKVQINRTNILAPDTVKLKALTAHRRIGRFSFLLYASPLTVNLCWSWSGLSREW